MIAAIIYGVYKLHVKGIIHVRIPKPFRIFCFKNYISPEEIEATAKKHPKFAAALKAHPELYNKYKKKIDKQQGGSEKPPVKEQFTYINPFNRDNLL